MFEEQKLERFLNSSIERVISSGGVISQYFADESVDEMWNPTGPRQPGFMHELSPRLLAIDFDHLTSGNSPFCFQMRSRRAVVHGCLDSTAA